MRKKLSVDKLLLNGIRLLAFLFVLPIVHTIFGSFMDRNQLSQGIFQWIPELPSLTQYFSLVLFKAEYMRFFLNSAVIAVCIIVLHMILATLTGYGLAMYRFKGKKIIFIIYTMLLLMPFQVTFVPNLLVFQKVEKLFSIQIFDTHLALILPGVYSVFGVYLMAQYIQRLPIEIVEAARVEGANELRIFWSIVLPCLKPALFSLFFLTFVDYWNLIEQAVLYLTSTDKQPLSVFLEAIYYQDHSVFYAGAVLYTLPSVYIFIKCERYLREGIFDGGRR